MGDKGVKSLLDMVMAVNPGEMDRDSGSNTAMTVYGMDFGDGAAVFPSRSAGVPPKSCEKAKNWLVPKG